MNSYIDFLTDVELPVEIEFFNENQLETIRTSNLIFAAHVAFAGAYTVEVLYIIWHNFRRPEETNFDFSIMVVF